MGTVFKAEKRSILVEQVANQIREAIKSKKLKPGKRLIETDLANDMETGRNAVREAIRYLEKEGL
jgi:DNA-binding GntR family transcriptional regulator